MNLVTQAWDWTMHQPDTVKAAVLTAVVGILALTVNSIVSVVATAVNNYVTLHKLREELEHDREKTDRQLQHEREQNEAERKLTLRREIYLGVAALLQDTIFAITDFANVQIDRPTTLATWRRNYHFAAKLHLMAGPDLVRAHLAAQQAAATAITEVVLRRNGSEVLMHQINGLRERMRYHNEARERALETYRQRGRDGVLDEASRQRLSKIIDAEEATRVELRQQHDKLLEQLRAAQVEVMRFAETQLLGIYPLFIKVAEAARNELGETFDATAYEAVLTEGERTTRAILDRAFGEPTETAVSAETAGG